MSRKDRDLYTRAVNGSNPLRIEKQVGVSWMTRLCDGTEARILGNSARSRRVCKYQGGIADRTALHRLKQWQSWTLIRKQECSRVLRTGMKLSLCDYLGLR